MFGFLGFRGHIQYINNIKNHSSDKKRVNFFYVCLHASIFCCLQFEKKPAKIFFSPKIAYIIKKQLTLQR